MADMTFRNVEDLLAFLTTSRYGRMILREAVFGGEAQWLVEELLDQNHVQHVIVKAYRDGLVEVYGSRQVQARIVFLNRSQTFPEHEIMLEEAVENSLPWSYRDVHFPSSKRAVALRGHDQTITVSQGWHHETDLGEAPPEDTGSSPLQRSIQARSRALREVQPEEGAGDPRDQSGPGSGQVPGQAICDPLPLPPLP